MAVLSTGFFIAKGAAQGCSGWELSASDAAIALLGACGGVLVALATLYAGSVHKAIATSSSIIIIVATEWLLFPGDVSIIRALAAASIANAVLMYSTTD